MGSSSSKTLEERLQTEPIEEIYTSLFLQNNPSGEHDRIEFMKLNDFKTFSKLLISLRSNGSYGIHFASQDGHNEVVKQFLELGVDVNITGENGCTSLRFASERGHKDATELLLNTGANVNVSNINGCTPLIFASSNGHKECVALLLKAGANINACDNNGDTPLHFVSRHGKYKVAEMLVNAGADINITNNDGYTPDMIAKNRNRETFVALFDRVRNAKQM